MGLEHSKHDVLLAEEEAFEEEQADPEPPLFLECVEDEGERLRPRLDEDDGIFLRNRNSRSWSKAKEDFTGSNTQDSFSKNIFNSSKQAL